MIKKLFIAAALLISSAAFAQKKGEDPQSYLTYSLPMTTITLEVEAVQEVFHAGPYAKYAEKFLGIVPRMKDETLFQLTQVKMTPYVEADQSRIFRECASWKDRKHFHEARRRRIHFICRCELRLGVHLAFHHKD